MPGNVTSGRSRRPHRAACGGPEGLVSGVLRRTGGGPEGRREVQGRAKAADAALPGSWGAEPGRLCFRARNEKTPSDAAGYHSSSHTRKPDFLAAATGRH